MTRSMMDADRLRDECDRLRRENVELRRMLFMAPDEPLDVDAIEARWQAHVAADTAGTA